MPPQRIRCRQDDLSGSRLAFPPRTMTRERLDAHPVESEYWPFPCDLRLTIRVHDGDVYLAIQTGDLTRREPVSAATVMDSPSQHADLHHPPESTLAFVWRQFTRLAGMCVALFETRSQTTSGGMGHASHRSQGTGHTRASIRSNDQRVTD